MNDIISTKLFETEDVSVFRIPPGELSLSKWDINDSNIIWRGSLRLTEEELIQEDKGVFLNGSNGVESECFSSFTVGDKPSAFFLKDTEVAPIKPYKGLRLKLELFNYNDSLVAPPNESGMEDEKIWAEVWYNPLPAEQDNELDPAQYSIANNKQETIQMTPQSAKFYKLIVQLPGSGYHPFIQEEEQIEDGYLLQVALGLKISENFAAISFSESLSIYRRRFKNFVDQYNYELRLSEIEGKQKHLSINTENNPEGSGTDLGSGNKTTVDNDDNDEDEFGDFVGG